MKKKTKNNLHDFNAKLDLVIEAIKNVLAQKLSSGLADVESKVSSQTQSKLTALETLCQGTQEVLRGLGVRLVKVESNAAFLSDKKSGQVTCVSFWGLLMRKLVRSKRPKDGEWIWP